MIEFSAIPVVGLTCDGVVESWNHAAESLFGYSAAEIVGQPIAILGRCADRHQMVDTIRCVRGGGVVCNLETVRVAKDGRKIPVLLTVAPIRNRSGAVTGMSARVIDMSRTKLVEGALGKDDRRKE
jgi:PAS domain S-box-containing protein